VVTVVILAALGLSAWSVWLRPAKDSTAGAGLNPNRIAVLYFAKAPGSSDSLGYLADGITEALIHEHSHNKINMLWTLAPVLHNAFTPLYTSPFRPDPRPLHGVLLGVHAFLPIEGMYEELQARDHPAIRGSGFEERRRRVRERNAQACEMLETHAQPTETGRGVLDEIARCNSHYSSATVLLHG